MKTDLQIKDPWEMAKKGYEIGVNFGYKGIKENEVPSAEYLNTRAEICRKYIALAGYRLADMLKDIYHGTNFFG